MTDFVSAATVRADILSTFPPARAHDPLVQGLAQHLAALVGANSLGERLNAFIALIDWGRSGRPGEAAWLAQQNAMVGGPHSRWRLLVDHLEATSKLRTSVQQAVAEIIAETEGEN